MCGWAKSVMRPWVGVRGLWQRRKLESDIAIRKRLRKVYQKTLARSSCLEATKRYSVCHYVGRSVGRFFGRSVGWWTVIVSAYYASNGRFSACYDRNMPNYALFSQSQDPRIGSPRNGILWAQCIYHLFTTAFTKRKK